MCNANQEIQFTHTPSGIYILYITGGRDRFEIRWLVASSSARNKRLAIVPLCLFDKSSECWASLTGRSLARPSKRG